MRDFTGITAKLDALLERMRSGVDNAPHDMLIALAEIVREMHVALCSPAVFVSTADCDITWSTKKDPLAP